MPFEFARPGRITGLLLASALVIGCGDDDSLFSDDGSTGGAGNGGGAGLDGGGAGGSGAGGSGAGGSGAGGSGAGGSGAGGSGAGNGAGGEGAGTTGGAGNEGGAGGAGPGCDHQGIVTSSQSAFTNDGVLVYNGSGPLRDDDILVFELWFQYGAATTPHTFTFTGENYLDCDTCLVLLTDCLEGECARRFIVQSGTATVTALGPEKESIAASFEDIVAAEVVIDPASAVSTLVPNGETWCIDSLSIASTTSPLPGNITKP